MIDRLKQLGLAFAAILALTYAIVASSDRPMLGMTGAPECEIVAQQLKELGRAAEVPAACR